VSEPLFAIVVEGKPVPQGRPRVTRWGGVHYSDTLNEYREAIKFTCEKLFDGPPLVGPFTVCLRFAGARKGSDLDNLAKGVLDSLVDASVILDDDWGTVCRLVVEAAEGTPRTEIEIWDNAEK